MALSGVRAAFASAVIVLASIWALPGDDVASQGPASDLSATPASAAHPSAPHATATHGTATHATATHAPTRSHDARAQASIRERILSSPLPSFFEENRGQLPPEAAFALRSDQLKAYVTREGAVLGLPGWSVTVVLDGAAVTPVGIEALPGRSNHFIGNDPTQWVTDVPQWAKVRHPAAWPGIDVDWRFHEGVPEFDVRVAPGADAAAFGLRVRGADVSVEAGHLLLTTPVGTITHEPPVAFQDGLDGRRIVDAAFEVAADGRVGFRVGPYDPDVPLVIDPVFYSTYLGGGAADEAHDVAVDAAGNAYVAGFTSSMDFPATPGAWQPALLGVANAFVTKFDPTGSGVVYSTYLGGGFSDQAWGIAVDDNGNAFVMGATSSTTFPTTVGAMQTSSGGSTDAFITKLNNVGNGLLYSTYLGGPNQDNGRGIAIDAAGNAYVVGDVLVGAFPTTPGSMQPTTPGGGNGWLAKINAAGSARIYSTFIGGSLADLALGVALGPGNTVFVTGSTQSTNFPTTANAFQGTAPAGQNAFLVHVNAAGSAALYSTYLGGAANDAGRGVATDAAGRVYVVGETASLDFPVTPGVLGPARRGNSDGFVTKIDPVAGALVYSTYLGGSSSEIARAVAVDGNLIAYVAGTTNSPDFPMTAASVRNFLAGAEDAFAVMVAPNARGVMDAAYMGGTMLEHGWGIDVRANCSAYVAGLTDSTDFPVAAAFQSTAPGARNGWVQNLFACIRPTAAFTWAPDAVCHRSPVTFTFAGTGGSVEAVIERADWDFGDGATRSDSPPVATATHTYDRPGIYPVRLQVTDVFTFTHVVTRSIVAMNCPPILEAPEEIVVTEGELVTFVASGSDANGDPLTASAVPIWPGARFDRSAWRFTWQTDVGDAGTYVVWVTASDPFGLSDTRHVIIRVLPLPPELTMPILPPAQSDADNDGVPDAQDNCPAISNPDQLVDAVGVALACLPEPPADVAVAAPVVPDQQEAMCRAPAPRNALATLGTDGSVAISWDVERVCIPMHFLVWNGTGGHLVAVVPAEAGGMSYDALDAAPWAAEHRYYVQAEEGALGLAAPFSPARAVPTNLVGTQCLHGCDPSAPDEEGAHAVPPAVGLPPLAVVIWAAAIGLLVAIASGRFRELAAVTLIRAFSRLDRHELVAHPLRQSILEIVRAEPGVHHKELARRLGRARGVAAYHVQRLVDARALRATRRGGYRCYYPAELADPRVQQAGAVLRSGVARRLLVELSSEPGLTLAALARRVHVDPTTVAYHVRRFTGVGLVEARRDGGAARVFPNALAQQALTSLAM